MPEYRFSYLKGQSKPSHGLTAVDDDDAFAQMNEFIKAGGYTYIKHSMTASTCGLNFHAVPEPHPQINQIRADLREMFTPKRRELSIDTTPPLEF